MTLVKLLNFGNNWIKAELDEHQMSLITPSSKDCPSKFYSTGNLGYIDPSKVKGFYNSELKQKFSDCPDLKVYIDFEDFWISSSLAGRYSFIHNFEGKSSLILLGPIFPNDVSEKK